MFVEFFLKSALCFLFSPLRETQFLSYLRKSNTKFKFLKEMKTQCGAFLNTALDSVCTMYPGKESKVSALFPLFPPFTKSLLAI